MTLRAPRAAFLPQRPRPVAASASRNRRFAGNVVVAAAILAVFQAALVALPATAVRSPCAAAAEPSALRVLPERPAGERRPSTLYLRLQQQALLARAQRRAGFERLKTPADIAAWQQSRRQIFLDTLGPLPERGDLRAQTVGTLAGDGFRVEKVIFESRPHHHVTGNLYLPLTPGPHPAAIVPCGHSFNG